jgi:ribose 1,5-bisphosphokinase
MNYTTMNASNVSTHKTAVDGSGLIYVMGASGSGKDSLLRWVADHLQPTDSVVIAHRYITRASSADEASVALTMAEFDRRVALRCFALHWRSHGLAYGIGVEIDAWMDDGHVVLVNGSRAHLANACERYPGLLAVEIEVSPEVLRGRLLNRGRESAAAIDDRLARAAQRFETPPGCELTTISNDGAMETAGAQLLTLVRSRSS